MLTEIVFYKGLLLFEKVIPTFIEKIIYSGKKCLVYVEDEASCMKWDTLLWTYSKAAFLPHASDVQNLDEDHIARQPLFITSEKKNKNKASVLVNLSLNFVENMDNFEKIIEFTNFFQESVEERFSLYKGFQPFVSGILWQKQEKGIWESLNMKDLCKKTAA